MRWLLLLLTFFGLTTLAHGSSATYQVTLYKGGDKLTAQLITVQSGEEGSVKHAVPFRMTAACSTSNQGAVDTLEGTGKSEQTVTLKTVAVGTGAATVVVTLANSELLRTVPTRVGPCTAATPGMLKWDASAKLTLGTGQGNAFEAGEYRVEVRLIKLDATVTSDQMAI